MTILTRKSLERVLGPLDEAAAAAIAGLGTSEEAMGAAGKPLSTGRVAQILAWLQLSDDEFGG